MSDPDRDLRRAEAQADVSLALSPAAAPPSSSKPMKRVIVKQEPECTPRNARQQQKPVFIKQEQISPTAVFIPKEDETLQQKIDRLCVAGLTDAKRAIVVKQELLSDDEAGPMAAIIQRGEASLPPLEKPHSDAQRENETRQQKVDRLCAVGLTDAKRATFVKREPLNDDEVIPRHSYPRDGFIKKEYSENRGSPAGGMATGIQAPSHQEGEFQAMTTTPNARRMMTTTPTSKA